MSTSGAAASEPVLSVIIVSWNVAELTEQCIASVLANSAGVPLEILLVDNHSRDDVVARVRTRFPQVIVLVNEYNAGFPRANNQALARARGRYVLFLNPDTRVGPGTLRRCVAELDSDATLGVAGCRLVDGAGRVQLECGRHAYRLRHLLAESLYLHVLFPNSLWCGHHRMSWWDHADVRDVEAVSGAFLTVRADLARTLGGLPEDFFMYHEDLSFCLRVQRLGYRLRCLGDVTTVHLGGRSSASSPLYLDLLMNEVRMRLIQEAEGKRIAALARMCWGVAGVFRTIIAVLLRLIPGPYRERPQWQRVLAVRRHALQIAWAFLPFTVAHRIPQAPQQSTSALRQESMAGALT